MLIDSDTLSSHKNLKISKYYLNYSNLIKEKQQLFLAYCCRLFLHYFCSFNLILLFIKLIYMYIFIYAHIYIYIHIYMYTYVYIYTYTLLTCQLLACFVGLSFITLSERLFFSIFSAIYFY
jgi:hypothetical protein